MGNKMASGEVLTRAEQEVLSRLPSGAFLTAGEIAKALKREFRRGYLSELLARLAGKGALLRLKRGVYYRGSLGDADFRYKAGAAYADGKAYAALGTALYRHGMVDQPPTEYFFATEKLRRKVSLFGADYSFVPFRKHYYGSVDAGGFRVSTKAKTAYDCLLKPKLLGGVETVIGILGRSNLSGEDWSELLSLLTASASNRMRQTTGVLLEARKIAPKQFTAGLHRATNTRTSIVAIGPGREFSRKWGAYA